jgi:hypothetical protein
MQNHLKHELHNVLSKSQIRYGTTINQSPVTLTMAQTSTIIEDASIKNKKQRNWLCFDNNL